MLGQSQEGACYTSDQMTGRVIHCDKGDRLHPTRTSDQWHHNTSPHMTIITFYTNYIRAWLQKFAQGNLSSSRAHQYFPIFEVFTTHYVLHGYKQNRSCICNLMQFILIFIWNCSHRDFYLNIACVNALYAPYFDPRGSIKTCLPFTLKWVKIRQNVSKDKQCWYIMLVVFYVFHW